MCQRQERGGEEHGDSSPCRIRAAGQQCPHRGLRTSPGPSPRVAVETESPQPDSKHPRWSVGHAGEALREPRVLAQDEGDDMGFEKLPPLPPAHAWGWLPRP